MQSKWKLLFDYTQEEFQSHCTICDVPFSAIKLILPQKCPQCNETVCHSCIQREKICDYCVFQPKVTQAKLEYAKKKKKCNQLKFKAIEKEAEKVQKEVQIEIQVIVQFILLSNQRNFKVDDRELRQYEEKVEEVENEIRRKKIQNLSIQSFISGESCILEEKEKQLEREKQKYQIVKLEYDCQMNIWEAKKKQLAGLQQYIDEDTKSDIDQQSQKLQRFAKAHELIRSDDEIVYLKENEQSCAMF